MVYGHVLPDVFRAVSATVVLGFTQALAEILSLDAFIWLM